MNPVRGAPVRFSRDVSELFGYAKEQNWRVAVRRGGGLCFYPPAGSVRPGYAVVAFTDPGRDSHALRVIRDRLRKAGLKLDDYEEGQTVTEKPKTATAQPVTAAKAKLDNFEVIAQCVESILNATADIAKASENIRKEHADYLQLRTMLRATLGTLE